MPVAICRRAGARAGRPTAVIAPVAKMPRVPIWAAFGRWVNPHDPTPLVRDWHQAVAVTHASRVVEQTFENQSLQCVKRVARSFTDMPN